MARAWNSARDGWRQLLASHGRSTAVSIGLILVLLALLAVVSEAARSILGVAFRFGSIGLVVLLAFDLVLQFSRGPSAFDGAGEEFRGPSARAAVLLIVAVVAAIAFNWVGGDWARELVFGPGSSLAP